MSRNRGIEALLAASTRGGAHGGAQGAAQEASDVTASHDGSQEASDATASRKRRKPSTTNCKNFNCRNFSTCKCVALLNNYGFCRGCRVHHGYATLEAAEAAEATKAAAQKPVGSMVSSTAVAKQPLCKKRKPSRSGGRGKNKKHPPSTMKDLRTASAFDAEAARVKKNGVGRVIHAERNRMFDVRRVQKPGWTCGHGFAKLLKKSKKRKQYDRKPVCKCPNRARVWQVNMLPGNTGGYKWTQPNLYAVRHFMPYMNEQRKSALLKLVVFSLYENGFTSCAVKDGARGGIYDQQRINEIKNTLSEFGESHKSFLDWAANVPDWPTDMLISLSGRSVYPKTSEAKVLAKIQGAKKLRDGMGRFFSMASSSSVVVAVSSSKSSSSSSSSSSSKSPVVVFNTVATEMAKLKAELAETKAELAETKAELAEAKGTHQCSEHVAHVSNR